MQFTSYYFILFFLPITVLLFFLSNKINPIIGKLILIVASIIFYSYGHLHMLMYLGMSILINYIAALIIRRCRTHPRIALSVPVIINVGLLLYFKYLGFAITNLNQFFGLQFAIPEIVLPLGISFYTFQQIAYIVAIGNGELEDANIIDYLTYILFFPKLIMGPIIDPVDFIRQINNEATRKVNATNIAIGIKLFSFGLFKKMLIADTFAGAYAWIKSNVGTITAMDCFLGMLFYTFEIYFDFSGYSDMAIGTAYMFNIQLPMNFDSPYKAISIRDFWKRWHISLTKFLTKYIYIPLGGSRKGLLFTYINTMIVFLVSGLWHGANYTFLLWGLLHGLFSCFDRAFDKLQENVFLPIRWLCTFGVVNVLWLLFSAESIQQWKDMLRAMLFMQDTSIHSEVLEAFTLPEFTFFYDILHLNTLSNNVRGFSMIIFIIAASIICFIPENNYRKKEILSIPSLILASIAFVWGLLCLGGEATFIYWSF